MTNVVQLVRPADRAMSRSRSEAVTVIAARIRQLLHERGAPFEASGRLITQAAHNDLTIFSFSNSEGTYFSVSEGGKSVMTGYLNPTAGKVEYPEANISVMNWKRGEWQARLFG